MISVGRVMTCVLGMVVNREREIREFVKTPFYKVSARVESEEKEFDCEWKAVEGTKYYGSPLLYKENGFKERKTAEELVAWLEQEPVPAPVLEAVEKKKETKNPPLLYNLAELQNDCSKYFKISPDETLRIVQELYEKKMTTYPRTDARVLSSAVAKEIYKNINGLKNYPQTAALAEEVLQSQAYKNIAKTRYVNDKQITDHYAIIPTGQGIGNLNGLNETAAKVYEIIARRFLSIFYPAAVYRKISLRIGIKEEKFFANFKVLEEEGYLKAAGFSFLKKKEEKEKEDGENGAADTKDPGFIAMVQRLKKGTVFHLKGMEIKEGETSPPKRYNSGTMILTMENAGQFIEDEELRPDQRKRYRHFRHKG